MDHLKPESLELIEASQYVWNSLWSRDADNKASFRILDTIQWSRGRMQSWIFTATSDGLIKSKSRPRWNFPAIEERCWGNDRNFCANICVNNDWYSCNDIDELQKYTNDPNCQFIIPYGQVSKSGFYVEHEYEAGDGIKAPKSCTYRLLGDKTKGKVEGEDNDKGIPSSRVISANKVVNELARMLVLQLVKIIQHRTKHKIRRMTCTFIVEDISRRGGTTSSSLSDSNNEGLQFWLHHVNKIVIHGRDKNRNMDERMSNVGNNSECGGTSVAPSSYYGGRSRFNNGRVYGSGSVASEMRSVTTDITNVSSSFARTTKCNGDFCSYSEEEELHHMKMSDETGGGTVHREIRKALERHRGDGRIAKSEWRKKLLEGEEEEDVGGDVNLKLDPERAAMAGATSASGAQTLEDELDPDTPLVPKKSEAHKVPRKSLVLARKDMSEVADAGQVRKYSLWPEVLRHWFFRLGRSLIQNKVSNIKAPKGVPITSGHVISNSIILTPIESNTFNKTDGRNDPSKLSTVDEDGNNDTMNTSNDNKPSPVRSSTPTKDGKKNAFILDLAGNVILDNDETAAVPYDLPGEFQKGGKEKRSVGQLSWYYSETSVCSRCYHVYCELDKRRANSTKTQLKDRRKAINEIEKESGYAKAIEKKIFQQRKFASRLAHSKYRKLPGYQGEGSFFKDGSMIDGSTYREPSYLDATIGFHDSLSSSSMASRFPIDAPLSLTKAKAPKGALPPMPWQLKDDKKRQEYLKQGGSFVRDIGAKAREMQEIVKQEKLLTDMRYQREQKFQTKMGKDFDWEKITGRHAAEMQGGNGNDYGNHGGGRQGHRSQKAQMFDSDRLLHPWQRHLSNLKAGQDPEEAIQNSGLKDYSKNPTTIGSKGYAKMGSSGENEAAARAKKWQTRRKRLEQGQQKSPSKNYTMTTQEDDALSALSRSQRDMEMNAAVRSNSASSTYKSKSSIENQAPNPKRNEMQSLQKYASLSGVGGAKSSLSSTIGDVAPRGIGLHPVVQSKISAVDDDYDDYDDDDDDDEEIGWSPFSIAE